MRGKSVKRCIKYWIWKKKKNRGGMKWKWRRVIGTAQHKRLESKCTGQKSWHRERRKLWALHSRMFASHQSHTIIPNLFLFPLSSRWSKSNYSVRDRKLSRSRLNSSIYIHSFPTLLLFSLFIHTHVPQVWGTLTLKYHQGTGNRGLAIVFNTMCVERESAVVPNHAWRSTTWPSGFVSANHALLQRKIYSSIIVFPDQLIQQQQPSYLPSLLPSPLPLVLIYSVCTHIHIQIYLSSYTYVYV